LRVKKRVGKEPQDTRSEMPYKQITQLPDSVKNNLLKHAQEIHKEAFNSAAEQYGEEDRATASPGAL
jgi:ChaB